MAERLPAVRRADDSLVANAIARRVAAAWRKGSSGTAVGHACPRRKEQRGLGGSRCSRHRACADPSFDHSVPVMSPMWPRPPGYRVGRVRRSGTTMCEVVSNKAIDEARGLSDEEVLAADFRSTGDHQARDTYSVRGSDDRRRGLGAGAIGRVL
jgi:hypothetical protein